MPDAMLSHIGICVTDVERSRRFYCELFGFEQTYSRVVNDDRFARLMQNPQWNVEVVMLALDGKRIELVHHFEPPPNVEPMRSTNTVGYTHIAMHVPDVRGTAERAVQLGGTARWDTHLEIDVNGELREYMYITDPDDVRIELIRGKALG
jgi:catechol 2,3-dioxygenase-like lactoylglutathione lyase family enzyme